MALSSVAETLKGSIESISSIINPSLSFSLVMYLDCCREENIKLPLYLYLLFTYGSHLILTNVVS